MVQKLGQATWAGSFGFSYDALSRRTQMTRPNNVTTNYSYDSLSRLLSVLHQAGGSTIDGAVYTLDPAGNRTAKTDDLAGVASNYTYDKIYELTQVAQGTNTTEGYSYDAVGNRLSSLGVSPYSYNNSNELASTPSGSYTYDANGNTLTDASGRGYTWDFENRLTQVTMPNSGGTATFKYDPLGRRIQKVFTTGANPPITTTTNYLYDDDNLIEAVDQNGNVVAKYAQDQGIDEPLAESASGATSFYEQDGLGSVTSLTNSSGALALSYTYDSFGKITASSGSVSNPFRYTGRDFDSETGLYYYRARYYDPSTGRFITEDPWHFDGGIDFYDYASNNPAVFADPFGNKDCQTGVKCRGVRSWKLGLLKVLTLRLEHYVHCYAFFTDSSGGTTIFSGGPTDRAMTQMGAWSSSLANSSEVKNFGKDKSLSPTCPDAPTGDCSKGQCLENVTIGYQNLFPNCNYKGSIFPNSNSFAQYVTHTCGLDLDFPSSAKGWDYHLKHPQSP